MRLTLLWFAASVTGITALTPVHESFKWSKSLIGIPKSSINSRSPSQSILSLQNTTSIYFTITHSNVIAALEPKSGRIVWRHQFLESDQLAQYLLCGTESLLVLSTSTLRSISAKTGHIIWQRDYITSAADAQMCCSVHTVTVSNHNSIRQYNLGSGEVSEWHLPEEYVDYGIVRLASNSSDTLTVLAAQQSQAGDSKSIAFSLTDVNGSLSASIALPSQRYTASNDPLLVMSGGEIGVVWIESGEIHYVQSRYSEMKTIERKSGAAPLVKLNDVGMNMLGVFVGLRSDGTAIVASLSDTGLKSIWEFSDRASNSIFASSIDKLGDPHIARMSYSSVLNLASLQIFSSAPTAASSSGLATGHTFPFDASTFGSISNFAIEVVPLANYRFATRVILTTTSGSVQMWLGTTLNWIREEGLACLSLSPVVLHSLADITSSDLEIESSSTRLVRQTRSIVSLVRSSFGSSINQSHSPTTPTPVGESSVILASSQAASLFAVDIQTGQLRWRSKSFLTRGCISVDWILIDSLVKDHTLNAVAKFIYSDSNLVVHKSLGFDSMTGELLTERDLDSSGCLPYRLRGVNAFSPRNSYSIPLAYSTSDELLPFDFTKEQHSNHVHQELEALHCDTGHHLWTLVLDNDEVLVKIVHSKSSALASPSRVLGNRTSLLKYLNPHLLAIVSFKFGSDAAFIYLIDAASGALAHQLDVVDIDCSTNLSIILRDNWIIYSYRSSTNLLNIVVSVELFETTAQHTTRSPFQPEERSLSFFSRSFVSPQALNVLGISRTTLGITTYTVLFRTPLGQILSIPRRLLDPRRPLSKLSKEDQEESLLPYDSLLPIDSRGVLSRDEEILGIEHIITAPGRLESSSFILGYGLDLFATTVSPSSSFDVLGASFNQLQLVITLSVLIVALILTRSMVNKKQMRRKWY